jgi:hypothetical protein
MTPKALWPFWLLVVMGALWIGHYFGGAQQRQADAEQLAVIEQSIVTVHDTVAHYDTLLRVDTLRIRIAAAHADTVRDTAWVFLARLDSAAGVDTLVPSSLVRRASLACSDAILSDSVALAAARTALRDCYAARTWSDSGRVLAEQRADLLERTAKSAVWSGRKQGAAVGAALAVLVVHFLK